MSLFDRLRRRGESPRRGSGRRPTTSSVDPTGYNAAIWPAASGASDSGPRCDTGGAGSHGHVSGDSGGAVGGGDGGGAGGC